MRLVVLRGTFIKFAIREGREIKQWWAFVSKSQTTKGIWDTLLLWSLSLRVWSFGLNKGSSCVLCQWNWILLLWHRDFAFPSPPSLHPLSFSLSLPFGLETRFCLCCKWDWICDFVCFDWRAVSSCVCVFRCFTLYQFRILLLLCLSVCLFVTLTLSLSVYLSLSLSVCLSLCFSMYQFSKDFLRFCPTTVTLCTPIAQTFQHPSSSLVVT